MTTDATPFITAVVRAGRPEPARLVEILTCLAAQTIADDVQVVVVTTAESTAAAETVLGGFEPAFRARTAVALGDGDAGLIDCGAELARGSYVALVDQHDLLTADWAEAFRAAADRAPDGAVLRSPAAVRPVALTPEPHYLTDYIALGPIERVAAPYDAIEHLAHPITPLGAHALPTSVLRGHRDRASAAITGDAHALLIDTALALGVAETDRPTVIHQEQRLPGAPTRPADEAWRTAATGEIRARLDARPLTLPPGSASRVADDHVRLDAARRSLDDATRRADVAEAELRKLYRSTSWRLTAPIRRSADLLRRRPRTPSESKRTTGGTPGDTVRLDAQELRDIAALRRGTFDTAVPFRHVVLDGLVPEQVLARVVAEFPSPDAPGWHHFDNAREQKLGSTPDLVLGPTTEALLAQLNGATFLEFVEQLTGIDGLLPDPSLFGGGLHQIVPGGYLEVHTDFNRHERLRLDRRLNLIIYLNEGWQPDWGGELELWDARATAAVRTIEPVFGRCVLFETTDHAPHGHPNPVRCPPGTTRKSLALYYYTNGRPASEVLGAHDSVFHRRVTG